MHIMQLNFLLTNSSEEDDDVEVVNVSLIKSEPVFKRTGGKYERKSNQILF